MIFFVSNNIVYFGGNEWLIVRRANNTQTYSAYIFTKSHDHIFGQMPNKSAHYWHRLATVVSVGETMSWEPGGEYS